jgi:hypothetical protein
LNATRRFHAAAAAHPLPKTYYDDMRPVVEEQLEKAGLRLAKTLEELFGK